MSELPWSSPPPFVHASTTEQWGLVVNEAMAAGLPVLVSERCGCASDLVAHGINGLLFDPYDVESFIAFLETLDGVAIDRTPAVIRVYRARAPAPAR